MIKIHLSAILGAKRMTQIDLARKSGVGKNVINEIYNELCERVSLENLDRICETLDCELSDILEYVPNKIPRTGKNLIIDSNKSCAKKDK